MFAIVLTFKLETKPTIVFLATPVFSLKPEKETEVVEGTSASLSCRADGYPTPAMTWFKDGTRLPSEERHVILTTGSLRILQVEPRDEGIYTCQAINVIGVRTARSRLIVKLKGREVLQFMSQTWRSWVVSELSEKKFNVAV